MFLERTGLWATFSKLRDQIADKWTDQGPTGLPKLFNTVNLQTQIFFYRDS